MVVERWRDDIADVFSVLPAAQARALTLDTLERLDGGPGDGLDVVWGEFDGARRLLRGGLTHWLGGTRIHQAGDAPPALAALQAAAQSARPGDVRPIPGADAFHWFAPHAEPGLPGAAAGGIKAFAVDERVFARLVARVEGKVGLTAAEMRLFFQVAAGLNAIEAAEADGVSVETKRTQMKSLYTKLECDGLADLVRRSVGCLTQLVALCGTDVREAAAVEAFVGRHLDADTRLSLQRMPSGRLLRFLELGAANGRPILVMHGMLFPVLLIDAARHLSAAGLRLIVPIRHGYLDETPAARAPVDGSLMAASLHDIATFARALLPHPITVLGHSNGSSVALRFAALYPKMVGRLLILSMNAGGLHDSQNSFSHRFFTGLQRLSLKPGVFGLLSWQFNKFYGDVGFVKTVLKGLFGGCPDDWALLEGRAGRPPAFTWFSEGYVTSTAGVADDFRLVMDNWRADAGAVRVPIRFIHGRRDTLVAISRMQDLIANLPGATLEAIDGGHLISATAPERVWKTVADVLSSG